MKGDQKTIEHLNKILSNELIAINQYFLHARILKSQGYEKAGAIVYKESIDEMKHADLLIERILFLEGIPNMQYLGKLNIGEGATEMFQSDLDLEIKAIADLKEAMTHAESVKDYPTRDMLDAILASEEEHIDWLETQLSLYETLGEQNYLQSIV